MMLVKVNLHLPEEPDGRTIQPDCQLYAIMQNVEITEVTHLRSVVTRNGNSP